MTSGATAYDEKYETDDRNSEELAIRLAAGIAHDFGNVVTCIMGRAEALLAEIQPSSPSYANLQGIQKDAQRATSLIHQLVDFAGGKRADASMLDVGEVVFDLAHILIPMLEPKIELTVVREPGLWACMTNQTQLEMALMNLVKNARDAMPTGGRIAVVARNSAVNEIDDHQYVVLEVFDNGPGMSDEVLPRIFEPFFSTKPTGKGSGLGLSNVRRYFRKNGGDVFAGRLAGKGSVFRGYLPRLISVT
jgi:two-component system cell cycle sensor histidine kinase/response regulator CckA